MLQQILTRRKELIKIMIDTLLGVSSVAGVATIASYFAVATAVVNPVVLTALGAAAFLSGVYMQFSSSNSIQITRRK
jgi:multisubunit Na+/H+ antiporter MnhG subunit